MMIGTVAWVLLFVVLLMIGGMAMCAGLFAALVVRCGCRGDDWWR